ncbi:MAG: alkane 1-monooxygenase [Chitinophagia bacterium]|nr:alkane 1-monooxygenase [Chitinophagia bacterium]
MQTRHLKFLLPFSLFVLAYLAFTQRGWLIASPVIYAFGFIPLLELLIPLSKENMTEAEEKIAKDDRIYDWWLYIIVPLQYAALVFFLFSLQEEGLPTWEKWGRIVAMGLLCGAFGINVGHELGHRRFLYERNLAKALLLTSLYMHFYIEHNKGHHKNVSTKEDPSSARKWEPIYLFYFRTVIFGFFSAWKIAADDQKRKGKPVLHFSNQMIQFQLLQIIFMAAIYFFFGKDITLSFMASACIGFLLLETVNYIEHYGLQRKKTAEGYERAMPEHSWNSSHILGRLMLFELSRHSDHHYLASRKYQVLRHHEDAPQMPTGYPGMMILSLIPPLWFSVMHKRMERFSRPA